jgi:5-methylcytosine-specific restriction endonuclease McrA
MDYNEQLQTKHWKKRSIVMKALAGFKCQACGDQKYDPKFLNVHHKVYKKGLMAWQYPDEDLIVLCVSCHRKVHFSDYQRKKINDLHLGIGSIRKLYKNA